ncbi:hypothetical protein COLO4_27004 [Corchorus olitorius]|uniref:Uncharacterized protein n=1 Tax=Corchorus olitorius TaxID=93759 RepID=A0A1R3HTU8_9ROSI|nr:hypothetical protein COLO4_27004 [Corchorus olitorius]
MNIEFFQLFRPPYYPVSPYFFHVTGPEGASLPVYEPELVGTPANGYIINYRPFNDFTVDGSLDGGLTAGIIMYKPLLIYDATFSPRALLYIQDGAYPTPYLRHAHSLNQNLPENHADVGNAQNFPNPQNYAILQNFYKNLQNQNLPENRADMGNAQNFPNPQNFVILNFDQNLQNQNLPENHADVGNAQNFPNPQNFHQNLQNQNLPENHADVGGIVGLNNPQNFLLNNNNEEESVNFAPDNNDNNNGIEHEEESVDDNYMN